MATFSKLIEDTRNELMTGQPDRINQLTGPMDDSTELITLAHAAEGISPGARISVGLEEMHVVSFSGQNVSVIRGMSGTEPQPHPASEIVYINPQFHNHRIADTVNRGLDDLAANGLFHIRDFSFTFIPTRSGYDLDIPDLIDIWQIRYDTPGPLRNWPRLDKSDYYVDQNADTSDFPSGKQLVLRRAGFPGHLVRVSYKAKFVHMTNMADDVEAVSGLAESSHDLPVLYAAYRLNSGREVKRSFLNRQPEPRRQEEVPPGSARTALEALIIAYYDRLESERFFLRRQFPETH